MKFRKIELPQELKKKILGLGSHTKNTVCLAEGRYAYLSRVHSDLGTLEDFLRFEKAVAVLRKKKPRLIALDLHPEYQSTKFARNLRPLMCDLRPIQHHHAHIASCMADNGLKNQKVIGVAFDGTGLGTENNLWGGEFLVCDYRGFSRKAHLKEVRLPGGEKAILEPGRIALSWLYSLYQERLFNLKIEFVKYADRKKWRIMQKLCSLNINSPLSSSMGRLFDAVASLTFARYKAGFEAELALELEQAALRCRLTPSAYKFKIRKNKGMYIIDPSCLFRGVVRDLERGQAKEVIAYKFHLTVAEIIRKMCLVLRIEHKIKKVVLSGGVFQNNLLLKLSSGLLYKEGFEVFCHKRLASNDSSISLGQVMIANYRV
jgi:hydrogenase maturation protein HypF